MKKFLSVILILLLLFTSMFVSSCNKEQTGDDTTAADTTETIENQDDIVIAINGEAAYSLIRYVEKVCYFFLSQALFPAKLRKKIAY